MKRPRSSTPEPIEEEEEAISTTLDFNQYSFQESATKNAKKSPTELALDFIDHVEQSLNRRRGCVDTLRLVVRFNRLVREEGEFHMQRWINYAINNRVRALSLSYHLNPRYKKKRRFVLPESLSLSKTLQIVDLFGCEFAKNSDFLGFSLKELRLSRVFIDEETLQSLVEGCRFLEELSIELCEGFEAVRVSGERLEVVELYLERGRAQIAAVVAAPRLRRLSLGGGFENVRGSFVASEVGGVKEVMFHDVSLEVGFLRQVVPLIPKLEFERCSIVCD